MNYDVRIDDNFLKADHSDGEVLQHTDLNELERVVKAAINANYLDIQKLEDGTILVSTANSLKGAYGSATLSQSVSETLVPSDNKIPSSLQVKNFVENIVNMIKDTNSVNNLVFTGDYSSGITSGSVALTEDDANALQNKLFSANQGKLVTLKTDIRSTVNLLGEITEYTIETDNVYYNIDFMELGQYASYKVTVKAHFTNTDGVNWVNDTSYTKMYISTL